MSSEAERLFHAAVFHLRGRRRRSGGDVVKRIGDDNVVISTDYPHADSHWPNAVNHFMAMDIPSGARRKILWDNCARLYGVS